MSDPLARIKQSWNLPAGPSEAESGDEQLVRFPGFPNSGCVALGYSESLAHFLRRAFRAHFAKGEP